MNPEEQNNNVQPVTSAPPEAEAPQATSEAPAPTQKEGVGPMVGVAIIVILLIFGGLYVWGTTLNNAAKTNNAVDETLAPITDIATPSDEPAAIEGDLNGFDATAFDAQLNADMSAIEAQF